MNIHKQINLHIGNLGKDDSGGEFKKMATEEELLEMSLHDVLHFPESSLHIMRVPGGWIYNYSFCTSESRDMDASENHVFVPERKLSIDEQIQKPTYELTPAWSESEYDLMSIIWSIFRKSPGTDGKKKAIAALREHGWEIKMP